MSKTHESTFCHGDSALEQDRSPQPIRFSAARILRQRHGLTQRQVSDMANIIQADVGEMEKYKPFGRIEKYLRPAAVLLAGFTDNAEGLLVGTNVGGLGTIIASLASLISFKYYLRTPGAKPLRYLGLFTLFNAAGLALLLAAALLLN